jgi:3-hydroxyacyl-CoA dehydrogenase
MKLLEIVDAKQTCLEVLHAGIAFGNRLNKYPVVTKDSFGFIGNRIYNAYRTQCEFMLEDGAWPEEVDAALVDFGMAMGPFTVADLSGLDIAWRMRKTQRRNQEERYVDILDTLCELGRFGRKTNAGYYDYANGKKQANTSELVRQIIENASQRRRIKRQTLSFKHIQNRALLSMVNEAALLMREGVTQRASDIDVVFVHGYGFPRWQGGPVFWARQQDRQQLQDDIAGLAQHFGNSFVPADVSILFENSP